MNLIHHAENPADVGGREARGLARIQHQSLAPDQQLDRLRDRRRGPGRDNDRAVAIRMDEVARRYEHPGNRDRPVQIDDLCKDMRRHDRPGQDEKALRRLIYVADRSVRHHAHAAKRLVDVRLDLAPEGAEASVRTVQVRTAMLGRGPRSI